VPQITRKNHVADNARQTSAGAQARADAQRIASIAKAKGTTSRAACRLLATEMVKAARAGRALEQAFNAVERGQP